MPTIKEDKLVVYAENGSQIKSILPASEDNLLAERDFSLVLGGPLFQLLCRAHLSGDAPAIVRKRIIFISMFAWLPLLILTSLEGTEGNAALPFLMDAEVHIRFLVALPLLIIAELVVHRRMHTLVEQFLERDLIPEGSLSRFNAVIASALRLRNSILAELLLIALVYVVGITIIWRQYMVLSAATWYATPSGGGATLSLAGVWFAYVSLPVFQFLLIRWYFRLFIWMRFLWQVSHIELKLIPTHPDRVGGLGFLSNTIYAFAPLALAHGTLLAGMFANRIFYNGARLTDFKMETASLIILLFCTVIGPLMMFAPQLAETKRRGIREYGALAQRYVLGFDNKWLRGGASPDETLLGSGDIQSLADLGNSFEVVKTMKSAPVTKDSILLLLIATLAPIMPLALTMMPLEELLKKLLGILF